MRNLLGRIIRRNGCIRATAARPRSMGAFPIRRVAEEPDGVIKSGCIYEFGPFRFEPGTRRLLKENTPIALAPKAFDLLQLLIENRDRAMTKSEILAALWPGMHVEDGSLAFQVSVLRKALGPEANTFIETVPRHGYRFNARVMVHPVLETQACSRDEVSHQHPGAGIGSVMPSSSPAGLRMRLSRLFLALVVVGAIPVVLYILPRTGTTAAPARPIPLTSFRGFEVNPALAPDATRVAFAWNGESQDNFDIYVAAIPSGAPLRLTSHVADDVSPAWSPDGRTSAFLRRLNGEKAELMLISAVRGPELKLADVHETPWFAPRKPTTIAWAPDGSWIAVAHVDSGGGREAIYGFSITGEKRRLTFPPPGVRDSMPALSPDGRTLAFCRLLGGFVSDIWLVPLDANLRPSGKERPLTNNKRWSARPVWTPDGRAILHVFGDDASQGREIRKIDVAEPLKSAKIAISDAVSEIALGRHLIYSRYVEDTNIWRAELPKGRAQPVEAELFITSTRMDQTPQYSPDGSKIAFMSARSGSRELWVCNADNTDPVRFTFFNGPLVGHPSWSPDGQRIIFHARLEGPTDLVVVPAAGGAHKRMTVNGWEDHFPSYSRDGRWIFYSSKQSGDLEIWKMPADGGEPVQITHVGRAQNPARAPNEIDLFYHSHRDPGEIWRIPVHGGSPVKIAGPLQRFPVGFTVTSQGLYYGAPPHAGEQRFIRFFSFSNGQDWPVVLAGRPFHSGISVSPDGRYIIFDQYDESGSDLMLVENLQSQ